MNKYIALGAAAFVLFIAITLLPWTTVNAGSRGVVLEFGAFNGTVLEPGFHFLTPVKDRVVEMSVQQNSYDVENAETYTNDGQKVDVQTTLLYHADPADVGVLYQQIGPDYQNKIIKPVAEELIKNEFGRWKALDIPGNREKIAAAIEPVIRARLADDHIVVDDFVYKNEDFKDDYEAAIASTKIEEQNALKAVNVTKQHEETKKQAQLDADAAAYKTQKEVEALKIGGDEYVRKLEAEAVKTNAEASLEFAKHWEGAVPTTVTLVGGGKDGNLPSMPIILPITNK